MSESDVAADIAQDDRTANSSKADERFSALFTVAPVGIALVDERGIIAEANPALTAICGRDEGSLIGRNFAELTSGASDAEALRLALADLTSASGTDHQLHLVLDHPEDGTVRVKATITLLPSDRPGRRHPAVLVQDVNDLHLLREALRHQNVHDALTGLPNGSNFLTKLENAIVDRSRARLALVFLDIDGFRIINDGLGAEAGDTVLRGVANKLRAVFAEEDAVLARLTGDGFGVLLRGELSPTGVIALVEKALKELAEPTYVNGNGVGISASAGIVVRDSGRGTAQDMWRAAEITLHRAKEAGRAQWMLFEPDLDAADRNRYRLGSVIAGALENGEFELLYEPTVKLDGSGHLPVVNAMLRWNHPEAGMVPSEEFIPLADATGMTLQLGRWVLSEAVRTRARWRDAVAGPVPDLCIRLPARLAIDDNLVGLVRDELQRHDLPASVLRLCADVPTLLDPRGEVLDSIEVLTDLGVGLVLAVSGAADLELVHQHHLPVGFVVLTGRIVDALLDPGSENPATIKHLEHLIRSAKDLGVRIGAEGVRTQQQADRLAEFGVIAARGKFFRGPLTADDVADVLSKARS